MRSTLLVIGVSLAACTTFPRTSPVASSPEQTRAPSDAGETGPVISFEETCRNFIEPSMPALREKGESREPGYVEAIVREETTECLEKLQALYAEWPTTYDKQAQCMATARTPRDAFECRELIDEENPEWILARAQDSVILALTYMKALHEDGGRCATNGRDEGSVGPLPPLSVDCTLGPQHKCVPVQDPTEPWEYSQSLPSVPPWDVMGGFLGPVPSAGHVAYAWKRSGSGDEVKCEYWFTVTVDHDADGQPTVLEISGAFTPSGHQQDPVRRSGD